VALCFLVVVLGAYVRLTAAGLGCPDWPGCYGHLTPSGAAHDAAPGAYAGRPLESGKAWREMIHRYAAGTLALVILAIAALAVRARRARPVSLPLSFTLVAAVIVQALLGMLTVTWQLTPLIVTAHLLLGLTTLGLLWWLALSLPASPWGASSLGSAGRALRGGAASIASARHLAVLGLVALAVQIALGGWTSSNYAAIACPDFPLCQRAWWPPADFRDAFVLWHGIHLDYEGGLLGNAARTAIHLTHRLGALVASAHRRLDGGARLSAVARDRAHRGSGAAAARGAGAAALPERPLGRARWSAPWPPPQDLRRARRRCGDATSS